jgi:hypothetical protein
MHRRPEEEALEATAHEWKKLVLNTAEFGMEFFCM